LFLDVEDNTELNSCPMNGILFDEIYTAEVETIYWNFWINLGPIALDITNIKDCAVL